MSMSNSINTTLKNLKKRNNMKSLIIYLFGICCCFADGGFVLQPNEHATEPSQRATIFYANGIQDTFFQVSLEGEVSEFGWLVPVPSKPTLEQVEKIPEFSLNPLNILEKDKSDFYERIGPTTPIELLQQINNYLFREFDSSPTAPTFKTEKITLPDFNVDIIPPTGSGIKTWLKQHGFKVTEKSLNIINDYRCDGWYFCAIKLNASEIKKRHDALLPPIQFSFKTDKPVFPLRISAINNSPSLVDVKFFSTEVYSPLVSLLLKDIPTQKSAVQYLMYGQEAPNDIVLQPISYKTTRNSVNTYTFRKNTAPQLYPHLYCVNLKKWFTSAEMTEDIYFESGNRLLYNTLKEQLALYHDPQKGYNKSYHQERYGMEIDFTFEMINKLVPVEPYKNFAEYLYSDNDGYFNEVQESKREKQNHIFVKRDQATKKTVKKKLTHEALIKLAYDSLKNNKLSDELYDLQTNYRENGDYDEYSDESNYDEYGDDLMRSKIDLNKPIKDGKYVNSYQLQTNLTEKNIITSTDKSSTDSDIISTLTNKIHKWNPTIRKSDNYVDHKAVALKYLSEFANKPELYKYPKQVETYSTLTNKEGQQVSLYGDFPINWKYLYETEVYLRRIVHDNLVHDELFYAFSTEDGKSLPFNDYFFTLLDHKKKILIPILIKWLKGDQPELKHNAILALVHLSFLSLDHCDEMVREILVYKSELEQFLPLNPYGGNALRWAYILRLNYGLSTGNFANDFFEIIELLNANRKKEGAHWSYYTFNNPEVLMQLDKICNSQHLTNRDDQAEFRYNLIDYFFDGIVITEGIGRFSMNKYLWNLFLTEQAMKASKVENSDLFQTEKSVLINQLKNNKHRFFNKYDYWFEFKPEVYFASAFCDDPEVAKLLFTMDNLGDLVRLREEIHIELSDWLETMYKETKEPRYKTWQKLCVNSCTLSPEDREEFQDNFGAVIQEHNLSVDDVNKIMMFNAISGSDKPSRYLNHLHISDPIYGQLKKETPLKQDQELETK